LGSFPAHLQALLHAGAYPHAVQTVELIETHVSWVLLTGEFAYKIKRPVHYDFVDLRSAERRAVLCAEELRLNRRFAPELYVRVCPITAQAGEARIDGSGPVIEHAVQMRQFPHCDELDQLLAHQAVEPGALFRFGADLARIHDTLPLPDAKQPWGEPGAWERIALRNIAECSKVTVALGGEVDLVTQLQTTFDARVDGTRPLRSQRFHAGRVRECHGDLHAGNVVRYGGKLLTFDCLEFDAALRWIDIADDLAFLLADLDFHRQPQHEHALLSGYLLESGDFQACRLLRLFKAHRALVRARVTALRGLSSSTAPTDLAVLKQRYGAYLACAGAALRPRPRAPVLVLMHGLSGSGKSWLASQIAPALGLLHLRSDIERKRLAGVGPHSAPTRPGPAGEGLYSAQASARVYQRLLECAADVLAGEYAALIDATFARREERLRCYELARRLGIPCHVIHCQAPEGVLRKRILERRERADDPSDADLDVLSWQQARFEPVDANEPCSLLEISSTEETAASSIIRQLTPCVA
jgi:aminoglycoside phosphotransferase family enzyme/predicted kinase